MRSRPRNSARLSWDASTPHLTVTLDLATGRIVLAGELGRRTVFQLLEAIRSMAATDHRVWMLDTRELHSCDASGLRALAVAYRQAIRRGATLTVVGAGGWLRHALATIKLDHHVLGGQRYSLAAIAALASHIPTGYVAPRYPLTKIYVL